MTIEKEPCQRCGFARFFGRLFRRGLMMLGGVSLLFLILSWFNVPGWLLGKLNPQDPLQKSDYIVCLSAGGTNQEGVHRLLECVRLYKEGYAPKIIVTGTQAGYRELALEWGVPESDLIFETVADNTAQHPIYVAKLPGLLPEKDRFIIVSTLYHLGRARLMFEARGFKKFLCRAPRSVSVVCLGSPTEAVMRYSLWQNLDTGIKILREEIAILAFKCGRTE